MTSTLRKEAIVREALTMERNRLLQVGKKHAAAGISSLLAESDHVAFADIYDHIINMTKDVG